jgi:hypothetical protein
MVNVAPETARAVREQSVAVTASVARGLRRILTELIFINFLGLGLTRLSESLSARRACFLHQFGGGLATWIRRVHGEAWVFHVKRM